MDLSTLVSFLNNPTNSNTISALSIAVAWIIYRLGIWSQRNSVLRSVQDELDLHKDWVGNKEYTTSITVDPSWKLPSYVVFKLSTTAIDNAIENGPNLFLNRKLVTRLIGYKQRVNQLNQLIDLADSYQSNVELWKSKPAKKNIE